LRCQARGTDQREAARLHAVYTEDILSWIAAFAELARWLAARHERLDGAGYPRGLSAGNISIGRIITTADAITASRPIAARCRFRARRR